MIASHDTMTYLEPKYSIFRLFRWVYQTQTKPWNKQGKILDIRIRWDNKHQCWRYAHGIVMFILGANTTFIHWMFKEGHYIRLVHEDVYPFYSKKKKETIKKEFRKFAEKLINLCKDQEGLHIIDSKKNWTTMYCNIPYNNCIDCFWKFNLHQLWPSPKYWWNKVYKRMFDGYKLLEKNSSELLKEEHQLTIWSDFL